MGKRKTHDEFIKEMKNINTNIEILGEYINKRTKIQCKCLIDGYIWDVVPNSILSGCGCPKCSKKYRRTHEEFVEEIKIKNLNIEILGQFKTFKTKVKCKCLIDDYIWDALPGNLLKGHGCPKCGTNNTANKAKKTHKEFTEEIKLINPNIKILGEYTHNKIKIQCKCLIDDYIWDALPGNLLKGHGCPKCSKQYRRTHEEFVEEMKIKNLNIEILGQFINYKTKVQCKCLIDGHIWYATANSLLSGRGCPKCGFNIRANKIKKIHEEFIEEIKIKNPNIKILGEYTNNHTKIKCECLIDGHTWYVVPKSLLSGCGCPKCKSSKGEVIIENYCKNNYLQYISQYKIDKCRYKLPLPFDFALFNKNKLVALIEYQGKQHYRPVDFAGKGEEWAKKEFKKTKKRDQIKRDYCSDNNIPLIEIPYWIEDTESYLEEQLDKIINNPMQLSLI